jgi:hypothetical protein
LRSENADYAGIDPTNDRYRRQEWSLAPRSGNGPSRPIPLNKSVLQVVASGSREPCRALSPHAAGLGAAIEASLASFEGSRRVAILSGCRTAVSKPETHAGPTAAQANAVVDVFVALGQSLVVQVSLAGGDQ